jgi:hypothetical protein
VTLNPEAELQEACSAAVLQAEHFALAFAVADFALAEPAEEECREASRNRGFPRACHCHYLSRRCCLESHWDWCGCSSFFFCFSWSSFRLARAFGLELGRCSAVPAPDSFLGW